jgi:hypothetical protein
VRDAKTIIPERNPRTGQIVTDAEKAPPLPMHDDHVCAYRDYWDEQGEKLHALSTKFLFLKPKAQPTSARRACFEEEEEKALPDPPKGMITVNDWAKAKGLDLAGHRSGHEGSQTVRSQVRHATQSDTLVEGTAVRQQLSSGYAEAVEGHDAFRPPSLFPEYGRGIPQGNHREGLEDDPSH